MLRDRGIPVLEGTGSGLRALGHLLDDAAWRARPAIEAPPPVTDEVRERWLARHASGEPVGELEAMALLVDYGVPTVRAEGARSADEAVDAAAAIGYPVVLKTAAPGITHKSDVDGVRLGLADADEVRSAYEDVAGRLGADVVVAAMAPQGVEVALGVIRDGTFGPLVLVAAGGVLVELLHDRVLALPPVDEAGARRAIDALQIRPVLDGVRGAPAVDVDALAIALSRLSVLATDLGDAIDALDVNPVIVHPGGCVAVDALVEPARR
jgi:acyl-CoA synthetase (NDP forming)